MPRKHKATPHTPLTRRTMACHEKRRFRSEHDARKMAELHMLENMQLELDVYKCDSCRYWHLTSVK